MIWQSWKAEKQKAAWNLFELQEILDDCISITEGQLTGRRIEFIKETDYARGERAVGNPLHLRRILLNLLSNAVKYTEDGGRIRFCVHKEAEDENSMLLYLQWKTRDRHESGIYGSFI